MHNKNKNKNIKINMQNFNTFRIKDSQSNRSNPSICAPEGGILNENWSFRTFDYSVFTGAFKKFLCNALEYTLGTSKDNIFDVLEHGFGFYTKEEFTYMLYQVKNNYSDALETIESQQNEIQALRRELEYMNSSVFAALNRDITYMRDKLNSIDIKSKTSMTTKPKQRVVEQLDV